MFAAIDNWLFLILVGIAALFKLLSKAAESKSSDDIPDESTFPPPDPNTPRRAPQSSDEEQIRKFLEALGQPRGADVPPPLPPRTDVPLRPVAPVRPPPTAASIPEWVSKRVERRRITTPRQTREKVPPPVLPQVVEPAARRSRPLEAPVFDVYETTAPSPERERAAAPAAATEKTETQRRALETTDLVRHLRTAEGLRQAIILREIFGQPRSLRPLEDLPGTA